MINDGIDHVNLISDGIEGMIRFDDNNNKSYYYYAKDHLGSVQMVVPAGSGSSEVDYTAEYDVWGVKKDERSGGFEADVTEAFTGKEFDGDVEDGGLGLYYFGARYYDPEVGIWMSQDPMGQDFGIYNYAGNNPVIMIDPDGLKWYNSWKDFKKGLEKNITGGEGYGKWMWKMMENTMVVVNSFEKMKLNKPSTWINGPKGALQTVFFLGGSVLNQTKNWGAAIGGVSRDNVTTSITVNIGSDENEEESESDFGGTGEEVADEIMVSYYDDQEDDFSNNLNKKSQEYAEKYGDGFFDEGKYKCSKFTDFLLFPDNFDNADDAIFNIKDTKANTAYKLQFCFNRTCDESGSNGTLGHEVVFYNNRVWARDKNIIAGQSYDGYLRDRSNFSRMNRRFLEQKSPPWTD